MKKVVFILTLALGFAWNCHAQTWTFVQDSVTTYCTAPSATCVFSHNGNILPLQAGSLRIVRIHTKSNVTISSVSGGGGTWQLCPSCHAFNAAMGDNQDLAYNLSGSAGASDITVTLSGASSGYFGGNLMEFLPPSGSTSVSVDAIATTSSSSCNPCTGASLGTLTGTDLVIQVFSGNGPKGANAWNAFSSPYVTDQQANGIILNAPAGTAPVPTVGSLPSAGGNFTGIAFTSSLGSFTPPTTTISYVNFSSPQGLNCNPSCSPGSVQAANHLIFIEAGSSGANISSVSGGGTWVVPPGCRISGGGYGLSCAYVLSSTGSGTVNVTMSGNNAVSFAMWELATTGTPFTLDGSPGSASNSASFTPSGIALSISGSNDVVFQAIIVPGGTSASSWYPGPLMSNGQSQEFLNPNASAGALLDTSIARVPSYADQQNNATFATGIAFKTGTGPAPPAPPTGLAAVIN